MTTIETIRDERAKLEVAIHTAAANAVAAFRAATGLTPCAIDVRMIEITKLGAESEYLVDHVSSTVSL